MTTPAFTWAGFALARSAAHASLSDVFAGEFGALTLEQGSRLITDLIELADREHWTDLYKATQELRRRIHTTPGYLARYVDVLFAGDEQPRYEHDCDHCIYLGPLQGEKRLFDLYYHAGEQLEETVLARYSSYGPDYNSGMAFTTGQNAPLTEALRRAVIRGLRTP